MRQRDVKAMFSFNLSDGCALLLSGGSLEGNCRKNSKRQQCEMEPEGSERKTQDKPIKVQRDNTKNRNFTS